MNNTVDQCPRGTPNWEAGGSDVGIWMAVKIILKMMMMIMME